MRNASWTRFPPRNAPLIVAPPALCTRRGRDLIARLENAIRAPVVAMESPRGINDPALGCYAQILGEADLIVLLGKPLDFTLRFGRSPPLDSAVPVHCGRAGPGGRRAACEDAGAGRVSGRGRCGERRRRLDRSGAGTCGRCVRRGLRGLARPRPRQHRLSAAVVARRAEAPRTRPSIPPSCAGRSTMCWRARPTRCSSATAARSASGPRRSSPRPIA